MEHSAAIAAILGGAVGHGLGRASHLGVRGLILGAIAGALGGAWLALAWASTGSGRAPAPVARRRDLYDPWLDGDRPGLVDGTLPSDEAAELVAEGDALPARVRPRVYSLESGESLPLQDEIGPILAAHERGAIRISGPDGSGKSTALAHLARLVPPHFQVEFLDEPDPKELAVAASLGRVVFASDRPGLEPLAELKLAPWGRDEWIESLLAADRETRASVMARLARPGADPDLLGGNPELWSIVLDLMAADESIEGPRQALRVEFERRHPDGEARDLIRRDCLDAFAGRGRRLPRRLERLRRRGPEEPLFRLIRHRATQLLLAADRIVDDLAGGAKCPALAGPLPRDLVREAASRIAGRPGAMARLPRLLHDDDVAIHPMAASLMHAMRVGWRPDRPTSCLKGAYLEEAPWEGITLVTADLRDVDLSRAELRGAQLNRSRLDRADLTSADLRAASLRGVQLRGADLRRARLAGAHAEDAVFASARLDAADLSGASLNRAILRDADLSAARLSGASLVAADLMGARVEGADFSEADLSGAALSGLKLAGARFEGTRFREADLSRCDLEEMVLEDADFEDAKLGDTHLTGSRMPRANFRGATLRGAGLALVEWEGADLRGADLREASFHLGSSRSGLVGSTTACEGSRTGFYTDDYQDQDFKSPEEIRKANLRGADLRGAILIDVDFYLVDLRDAKIDPKSLGHLRRCGAIL